MGGGREKISLSERGGKGKGSVVLTYDVQIPHAITHEPFDQSLNLGGDEKGYVSVCKGRRWEGV